MRKIEIWKIQFQINNILQAFSDINSGFLCVFLLVFLNNYNNTGNNTKDYCEQEITIKGFIHFLIY